MTDRRQHSAPGVPSAGIAIVLAGAVIGAATLFLASPAGKKLFADFSLQADAWLARAADSIAQTQERVLSGVEASPERSGRTRPTL